MPVDSPIVQNQGQVSAFVYDYQTEGGIISNKKLGNVQIGSAQIADLAVTNAKIDSMSADKLTAGTLTVAVNVGTGISGGAIVLDGGNNRILISDGTNNRILIGYQSGGF